MEARIKHCLLTLKIGDITGETTDAIVNAANSGLRGGGGVDGAIHRAGGPAIMEECRKIGSCPPGSAVITTAGRLQTKYVIHAVGPIYHDGRHDEEKTLKSAYRSCLILASRRGIKSLAFPALSTGAYGYPLQQAARIALDTVIEYIKNHDDIQIVHFVLYNQDTYEIFKAELASLISNGLIRDTI